MCYSVVEVKEVARIGTHKYDVAEFSYVNEDCLVNINPENDREGHWAISNKHEADEKYWFSTEEALKQAREYSKAKSIQYPERTIVLIDGLQNCNGGCLEVDFAEVYDMNGNALLEYKTSWPPIDERSKFDKLTDEMMTKIRARQVIIEEEERIEEIKREGYWAKRRALDEPIKKAYEQAYQGYMYGLKGRHYRRYNEKGFVTMKPDLTENDPEWKAYEAGAKEGFKVAFKYLQQHEEELNAIIENFINGDEKA